MRTNMLLLRFVNETKNLRCSPTHWPVQSSTNTPIGTMQSTDDCYAANKKTAWGLGVQKLSGPIARDESEGNDKVNLRNTKSVC